MYLAVSKITEDGVEFEMDQEMADKLEETVSSILGEDVEPQLKEKMKEMLIAKLLEQSITDEDQD